MRFALVILILSISVWGYSLTLSPYTDDAEFHSRYSEMDRNDSDKYFAMRQELLSPKYKLQDYGVTGVFLALLAGALTRFKSICSPSSIFGFVMVALVAPILTAASFVFDLIQAQSRGEFPHWADSLNIPFAAVPVIFVLSLIWSLAHLVMLAGVRRSHAPLHLAVSRQANPWLIFVSFVTAAMAVVLIAEGAYFYVVSDLAWVYLYLSIAAVRRTAGGAQ